MHTPIAGLSLRTLLICLPLALNACDNDRRESDVDTNNPVPNLTGPLATVQAGSITGTIVPGRPPIATGDIQITVQSPDDESRVINGGSTIIPISSTTPFSSIYITSGQGSTATNYYHEIQLSTAVSTSDLIVTFDPTLDTRAYIPWLTLQTGAPTGQISDAETVMFDGLRVGAGDLQVSVNWTKNSDVDLHLIEPDGTRIYFGNARSDSGGELDLDSNAACVIDGIRNENITYQFASPPTGEYTLIVDYWSDCDQGETDYVVTLRNQGQISTYTGVLQPTDHDRTVTTFEVPGLLDL